MLGLSICWVDGQLRWWDQAAQRCLETHNEEAEARIAEETRAEAEREGRIAEQEAPGRADQPGPGLGCPRGPSGPETGQDGPFWTIRPVNRKRPTQQVRHDHPESRSDQTERRPFVLPNQPEREPEDMNIFDHLTKNGSAH